MFSRLTLGLAIACVCASTSVAQTTTMDFSSLKPYANYDPAPQTFGDHANLNVTGKTRTAFGNGAQICDYIEMWNDGYSALSGAGFACQNGRVGELYFQPTAGHSVLLNSLFVGSYSSVNGVGPVRPMTVKVFDIAWNELFTFAGDITTSLQINPGVSSTQGLYLQWGTDYNTGVNLITTTVSNQTPPPVVTPEPASFVLVGAGIGFIGMLRRRRQG